MKSRKETLVFSLSFLIGLSFFSLQGFAQVQKMSYEIFQSSGAVNAADKERVACLLDGAFATLELTASEDFYGGEGDLKMVSLSADASLYQKLTSIDGKSTVEMIKINFNNVDSLPSEAIFQGFPNLKFILVQGIGISDSQISAPAMSSDRGIYLLIRNISAD